MLSWGIFIEHKECAIVLVRALVSWSGWAMVLAPGRLTNLENGRQGPIVLAVGEVGGCLNNVSTMAQMAHFSFTYYFTIPNSEICTANFGIRNSDFGIRNSKL